MKLSHLLIAAGLALLATPALAATSEPAPSAPAAPRYAFFEALLGPAPFTFEAPKAAPVDEAPAAQPAPAAVEPRPASPDLAWASAMRSFAER